MTTAQQKSFERFKDGQDVDNKQQEDRRFGFVIGYEQCQEDFVNKASKWIEKELRGVFDWEAIENTIEKFKQDMTKEQ